MSPIRTKFNADVWVWQFFGLLVEGLSSLNCRLNSHATPMLSRCTIPDNSEIFRNCCKHLRADWRLLVASSHAGSRSIDIFKPRDLS